MNDLLILVTKILSGLLAIVGTFTDDTPTLLFAIYLIVVAELEEGKNA